ncbi:MAG: hypothetical protein HY369_03700 [Candidatus Aenigmarchaeota archaeon]|nr:hypothetical protein [Candidatus Aenigmarchaeota archaeon]
MSRRPHRLSLDAPLRSSEPDGATFAAGIPAVPQEYRHREAAWLDEVADLTHGKPPRWLREVWEYCPKLRINEKALAALREIRKHSHPAMANVISEYALDLRPRHLTPSGRSRQTVPRGFLTSTISVFGEQSTSQKALSTIRENRARLRANAFVQLACQHSPATFDYFATAMCDGWHGQSLQPLLKSRVALESSRSRISRTFREAIPTILPVEFRVPFAPAMAPTDYDSQAAFFNLNYRLTHLEALFSPETAVQRHDSDEFPPPPTEFTDPNAYMLHRRHQRLGHLIPCAHLWRGWVKELLNYAADANRPEARAFAAYYGLYAANQLSGDDYGRILCAETIVAAWDKTALHGVIRETYENLSEPWYRENPYHMAINLLRLVVYLKAYPGGQPSLSDGRRKTIAIIAQCVDHRLGFIEERRAVRNEALYLYTLATQSPS